MKSKKKIILSVFIVFVVLAALFLIAGREISQEGYGISSGKIYKTGDTTYLIDNDDRAMIISDYSKSKNLFRKYNNGDRIFVIHGLIEETYPSRADTYFAFRTAKGDGKYNPDDNVLGIVNVDFDDETIVDHTHSVAEKEQKVDEPVESYCGNTQTTIRFRDGKSYTFMYGESVTMTDILINLKYKKNKVCKCLPEYTVDTEFDVGYGINLTEGYARCEKGQADLTKKQIEKLSEIIRWNGCRFNTCFVISDIKILQSIKFSGIITYRNKLQGERKFRYEKRYNF